MSSILTTTATGGITVFGVEVRASSVETGAQVLVKLGKASRYAAYHCALGQCKVIN